MMSVWRDLAPVVGTTDPSFVIDRISVDVEGFLGRPPDEFIGKSMLQLVHSEDAADLMVGLAQATLASSGVAFPIRTTPTQGATMWSQLLMVPLAPHRGFGFVLRIRDEPREPDTTSGKDRFGWRLQGDVAPADGPSELTDGLGTDDGRILGLSPRELGIVGRLVVGDRVPAIAAALFISQSTVRNHLSSVFRKLGVNSQQELISLLRVEGPPPTVG
jgi:DNA-binding CsgD family transcriptional regulator